MILPVRTLSRARVLLTTAICALALTGCAYTPPPGPDAMDTGPALIMPATLPDGADFALTVTGLRPDQTVRVHGLRQMKKWQRDDANRWGQVDVSLRAWGEFRADRNGVVDLNHVQPIAGTWREPGAAALFWSGLPAGAPELGPVTGDTLGSSLPEPGTLRVVVTSGTQMLETGEVQVITPPAITTRRIQQPGLVGVFAAPEGAQGLPVIVLLHGSEGGKLENAQADAARFAAQGYAVLAVTYFSYPWESIPGTPNAHVNIPVETIQLARDWLATLPEADVGRFGLYGVSKGAEFAALAAATYPWIDAVVPCVGSDVTWEGYGLEPRPTPPPASWSSGGEPVPFITLEPYVEGDPRWRTNTDRYEFSRRANSDLERTAARIQVERSQARFLLIGGGRDEVWASGTMLAAVEATMRSNGLGSRVESFIVPLGSHNICGSGLFPVRLYGVQGSQPWSPDLVATGQATVEAWSLTRRFFAETLQKR